MITAMIIDDEPLSIKTLLQLLERYVPEIDVIHTSSSPLDAVSYIVNLKPDLLFLDIQMPVLNGFELLKKLPEINFDIIFTTAFDQYAIEAIRFSALDYLLKPIAADDLKQAIDRYVQKQSSSSSNKPLYKNFVYNLNVSNKKDFKLALPTTEGTFFYTPGEIIFVEGINNYSCFFFGNDKKLLTSKTLKGYEEILNNHGFIRVNKSYLVNSQHVKIISSDGVITMTNNTNIEISRRRKEAVIQLLKKD